jgi:hypothetical protein
MMDYALAAPLFPASYSQPSCCQLPVSHNNEHRETGYFAQEKERRARKYY